MPAFRKRRDLTRALLVIALTFAVVGMLELLGWIQAGDAALRALYFRFGPARDSAHRVLIVSADAPVADDGSSRPLHWTSEQFRKCLHTLMRGQPAVVALVDPERALGLSADAIATIVEDPVWGGRVVVARSGTSSLGGATGITTIAQTPQESAWTRPHVLEVVSRRIAQSHLHEGPLPVHFLASRDDLPRIPLHTLSAVESQYQSFDGNIVLVGLTRPPEIEWVNTPIGPMSSLEIHAHGISGLVDGLVWDEPAPQTRWAIWLVIIAAWTSHLRRSARPGRIALTVGICSSMVTLDGVLFARGLVLWGPVSSVVGLWVAQFLIVRETLNAVTDKAGYLQTRLAEMLPAAVAVKKVVRKDLADDAFWQDLVDFGRSYVKFDFEAMIAELPEKEWHIQLRASTGLSFDHVAEMRRDVRRAPFRAPFLTQKAGWAHNFVEHTPFTKSMVVPLHHRSKLCGYWLLHMKPEQAVDDAFVRICEGIGRQMAAVISEKRGDSHEQEQEPADRGQLAMDEVERDLQRMGQERQWILELVEQDPDATMMASLWGPIELMNQRMRAQMTRLFPNGIPDEDIRAVLARLCSGGNEQVQALMRSAVVDGQSVIVPTGPDEDDELTQNDMRYTLRSIELGRKATDERAVPNMSRMRLVLQAKSRYGVPRAVLPAVLVDAQDESPPRPTPVPQGFERDSSHEAPAANEGPTPGAVPQTHADQGTGAQDSPDASQHQPPPMQSSAIAERVPTNQTLDVDEESQTASSNEALPPLEEEHENPHCFVDDGWEDWTPITRLSPDEDLALDESAAHAQARAKLGGRG